MLRTTSQKNIALPKTAMFSHEDVLFGWVQIDEVWTRDEKCEEDKSILVLLT